MTDDPFVLPVTDMFVTEKRSGVYHGQSDWPEDKPRQEPTTYRRVPIMALAYDSRPPRAPRWAIFPDGRWVDLREGWWFDPGPHREVREGFAG